MKWSINWMFLSDMSWNAIVPMLKTFICTCTYIRRYFCRITETISNILNAYCISIHKVFELFYNGIQHAHIFRFFFDSFHPCIFVCLITRNTYLQISILFKNDDDKGGVDNASVIIYTLQMTIFIYSVSVLYTRLIILGIKPNIFSLMNVYKELNKSLCRTFRLKIFSMGSVVSDEH